jgi:hypothetical protein
MARFQFQGADSISTVEAQVKGTGMFLFFQLASKILGSALSLCLYFAPVFSCFLGVWDTAHTINRLYQEY